MFYYVEFIQIANGNLSKLNIVVSQNSCVLLNSILLNLILAMLLFLVLELFLALFDLLE